MPSKPFGSLAFVLFALLCGTNVYFLSLLVSSKGEAVAQRNSAPFLVRLYTHNIRYDNRNPTAGEYYWEERRPFVTSSIKFNAQFNSIVSLQEVLHNQLIDILHSLNSTEGDSWDYYGVGREDGSTKGEYAPILFKTSEWELLDSGTFWLSETPERPSVGWDAALERIVTWVLLKNRSHGGTINVFNTHLDHRGVKARRESVKLILDKTKHLNEYPSFFCGDFNTEPTDQPYQIVSKTLQDTSTAVKNTNRYAHISNTFTGFDHGKLEPAKTIDYIWVPKSNSIVVKDHAILHSKFQGIFMSDHRPVVADILVNPKI